MKTLAIILGIGLSAMSGGVWSAEAPAPVVVKPSPTVPTQPQPEATNPPQPTPVPTPSEEPQGSSSNNQNVLEVKSRPQSSPTYQPRANDAPPQYNLNENRTYRTIWK